MPLLKPYSIRRTIWSDAAAVTVVTSVLAFFAIHRALTLPMWGDEVRTWRDSVNKTYGQIITWQHNADHAPLGHLLTKLSSDVFGTDAPWALRLPAVLFGIALVPLGYLLGRLAWGRLAGVLIALMICVDVTIVTQAHAARMYTQMVFWMTAAVVAGLLILQRRLPRPVSVTLLAIFLALAIWTHLAAMMLLVTTAAVGVFLLLRYRNNRSVRSAGIDFIIASAVAAVACTQGLLKLGVIARREKLPVANDHNSIEQLLAACGDLSGNPPLCIILFGLSIYGLWLLSKKDRPTAIWLTAAVVLGVVDLLIASAYRQIEGSRYLLVFLPINWLGLGVANSTLMRDRRRWLRITMVLLFVAGIGYQLSRTIAARPHPQAAPMKLVGSTIRKLGYTDDQTLVFVPHNPQQMGGKYYGLVADSDTYRRLMIAMHLPNVGPATLGRYRPTVLWMIVITPARKSEFNTPEDAISATRTAAKFYNQSLDTGRLPHDGDLKRMSIVRITPKSLQVWSPDGQPR